MSEKLSENELLLREGKKIVEALGKMFAPCCEVVLHDLSQPDNAILAIECPLSGRAIGQPTTEMGLARINDASFPDVIQNYANFFPDGRSAKSTSIGLRNSDGKCIAAICLNLDLSLFSPALTTLKQLTTIDANSAPIQETLQAKTIDELQKTIQYFEKKYNAPAYDLSINQRRELIHQLQESGLFNIRNAIPITADLLHITRATIYNILKKNKNE